ncbi:unnamed protein product [Allacma fusca]|uniref:N-acylneuraminate cytidylyltransferase n=1 Tax=Allacma fusca TaxID=39272 RepID=A0A8J2KUN7_9HEXA|nr:unnamed protein product [Allacma fusca]
MIAVLARVIGTILVFFNWYGDDQDLQLPTIARYGQSNVTGLVLARGGSKGIVNKNMVILNGFPLIHWSLDAMIKSGVFDDIWVSTNDPSIKEYALRLGVQVHDRAPHTATDHATSMVAVQEFLQGHPGTEAIALVQLTRMHQLRWSVALNEEFAAKPLNFDPKNRPRRQDWQGEFVENGMFYFSHRKLVEKGAFQNAKSCVVEIPKNQSLEIDSMEDLKVAEAMMKEFIAKHVKTEL